MMVRSKLSLLFLFITNWLLFSIHIYSQSPADLFDYIYPIPNSDGVRTETNLIFRLNENIISISSKQEISINVTGSKSGLHEGSIFISHGSIIFDTFFDFEILEEVQVEINIPGIEHNSSLNYSFFTGAYRETDLQLLLDSFNINNEFEITNKSENSLIYNEPLIINGVAVPADFPQLIPNINTNPSPGKIFTTNARGDNFYLMIFENDGTPYYYKKLKNYSFEFKAHSEDILTYHSFDHLGFVVMNSSYEQINLFTSGNGSVTDMHDIVITPEQTALIIGLTYRMVDMSSIVQGGNPEAIIKGNVIQELDWNNNVIFEWSVFDYFDITDALNEDLTNNRIDFSHVNSVALDYDGHILISSRNLNECTKIDRNTGEIIWRLGGAKNQFTFMNEELEFSYQHSFNPVEGNPNHYLIYDNGNHRGKFTRVVEYLIDPENLTAEKIWEYRADPDFFAPRAGNAQRLANGNTIINLEQPQYPKVLEITPQGNITYESNFFPEREVYKVFKFDWEGAADKPYLLTEPLPNAFRLIFNLFGKENITSYNIYGDPHDDPTTHIATSSIPYYDMDMRPFTNCTEYYFRVTAVNNLGQESEYSNTQKVVLTSMNAGNSSGIFGRTSFIDECDPIRERNFSGSNIVLKFDGVNDYVDCGNDVSIQIAGQNLTLEAWINVETFSSDKHDGVIIAKEMKKDNSNAGYKLSCGDAGIISFTIGSSSWFELSTPPNSIVSNRWYHVAATYDGLYQKIYINGELSAVSDPLNIEIENAANRNLYFGRSAIYEDKYYNGMLDDIRIWNVAREQDDIVSTMQIGLDNEYYENTSNGLVGYWTFNEDAGQIAEDLAKDNNKILNGGFIIGKSFWDLLTIENIEAEFQTENSECSISIDNGGQSISDIQLIQNNITLIQNEAYRLEFDAHADANKYIDVRVRKSAQSQTDYSRIGVVELTRINQHFTFNFTMNDLSDCFAELVFSIGGNNIDFHLDNVKLVPDITNDIGLPNDDMKNNFELIGNYPNPFNPETTIEYYLPETCMVNISIHNILGELITNLVNEEQIMGKHSINFRSNNLSSGIYLYTIEAYSINSHLKYFQTKKMILLK